MTRAMRLTLLAPDIVEAIVDGAQGPEVTLALVLEPFPVEWQAQSNRAAGSAALPDPKLSKA